MGYGRTNAWAGADYGGEESWTHSGLARGHRHAPPGACWSRKHKSSKLVAAALRDVLDSAGGQARQASRREIVQLGGGYAVLQHKNGRRATNQLQAFRGTVQL